MRDGIQGQIRTTGKADGVKFVKDGPRFFHALCSLDLRHRLVVRVMGSVDHSHDVEMGHAVPKLILPRTLRNATASHVLSCS